MSAANQSSTAVTAASAEKEKRTALDAVKELGELIKNSNADVVLVENDVKVVMNECDVAESVAESLLRANAGNLKDTLLAFLHQ